MKKNKLTVHKKKEEGQRLQVPTHNPGKVGLDIKKCVASLDEEGTPRPQPEKILSLPLP